MIFEHFALNVEQPVEIAKWYVDNLDMKIVKNLDKPPHTHFLADTSGRVIMELYNNKTAKIPDHKNAHLLEFHFAFMVDNAEKVKNKLIESGAKLEEDLKLKDGSHLATLRDPFGLCVQLCQRANPMMKF
jgi:glyoxylase I family protein